MDNATQNATTEKKTLSITDENISQADYERLRSGETIEVDESAPEVEPSSETVDESDTSKLEAKDGDADEESEVDETDDEALEVKPKKKSGTQRRIEKLVKQRTAVEQERDYLRQELLKAQRQKPESEKQALDTTVSSDEPNPDDFETQTDYLKALADHIADQKLSAYREENQKAALKTEQQKVMEAHLSRVDSFRKTKDDYEDVMEEVIDVNVSPAVEHLIVTSNNGPELLYELAKDKDEFERICKLDPLNAALEIGVLKARLSLAAESKTKEVKTKTTKAPPPARPVSATSANGKKSIYDEDISQAEYERLRAEQEKRRRAY